jgi:trans-aconitate 2-methyltransferase
MPWDPDQYHRFQSERTAPFTDLVALIHVRPGLSVVDLGCGTGELTQRLADLLPGSDVLGIDSSPEMLARAASHIHPGLRFEQGLIEQVAESWDLVFSTAALHWVSDHRALIPRLFGLVKPGGQLVVQVPSNDSHPSHAVIRQIAAEGPFRTALGGFVRQTPVLAINDYAEILYTNGADEIAAFEKVYPHILPDADAVAEWTKGSTLVPYLERLTPDLGEAFMAEYRARLRALWPQSPVFYTFRRTFFAGSRPDS